MNFFEFQVQFYFTLTEIVILHPICYLNLISISIQEWIGIINS